MKQCFPPVYAPDAAILILGSLPGEESLRQQQYYAHPRNHFWPLMEGVTGQQLVGQEYADRYDRLSRCHIALWDVVARAQRTNSLDQQLRDVEANGLAAFLAKLPQLRVIAFNGKKAAEIGRRALVNTGIPTLDLPSSSPANTLPLQVKLAQWMQLRAFLPDTRGDTPLLTFS